MTKGFKDFLQSEYKIESDAIDFIDQLIKPYSQYFSRDRIDRRGVIRYYMIESVRHVSVKDGYVICDKIHAKLSLKYPNNKSYALRGRIHRHHIYHVNRNLVIVLMFAIVDQGTKDEHTAMTLSLEIPEPPEF